MTGRTLAWSLALKRLATPQVVLPPVREQRLEWNPNRRGMFTLSSWIGKSDRGYVVAVHPFRMPDLALDHGTVLLAVRRDGVGPTTLLAVVSMDDGLSVWRALDRAASAGANELHVHHTADTVAKRTAVVEDLVV